MSNFLYSASYRAVLYAYTGFVVVESAVLLINVVQRRRNIVRLTIFRAIAHFFTYVFESLVLSTAEHNDIANPLVSTAIGGIRASAKSGAVRYYQLANLGETKGSVLQSVICGAINGIFNAGFREYNITNSSNMLVGDAANGACNVIVLMMQGPKSVTDLAQPFAIKCATGLIKHAVRDRIEDSMVAALHWAEDRTQEFLFINYTAKTSVVAHWPPQQSYDEKLTVQIPSGDTCNSGASSYEHLGQGKLVYCGAGHSPQEPKVCLAGEAPNQGS